MPVTDRAFFESQQYLPIGRYTVTNTPSVFGIDSIVATATTPRFTTSGEVADLYGSATWVSYDPSRALPEVRGEFFVDSMKRLEQIAASCGAQDWGGPSAVPISYLVIEASRKFARLVGQSIRARTLRQEAEFSIDPELDGDVNFSWFLNPDFTLDISVSSDEFVYFAARFGDSRISGRERLLNSIPSEPLTSIMKFYIL